MTILAAVLAQGNIGGRLKESTTGSGATPSRTETVFLVGVLVIIALTLIFLIYSIYQKRQRGPHPSLWAEIKAQKNALASQQSWQQQKHREPLTRNPTRAETGGLPPIRKEDPSPPPTAPPS